MNELTEQQKRDIVNAMVTYSMGYNELGRKLLEVVDMEKKEIKYKPIKSRFDILDI